jgi:hypothetical protein
MVVHTWPALNFVVEQFWLALGPPQTTETSAAVSATDAQYWYWELEVHSVLSGGEAACCETASTATFWCQ